MIGPALLLFAAQLVSGQQRPNATRRDGPPVPDQSSYTGPKGSISGTVTDSVTGAPIRKAQVNCNGTIAVTDASGSFTLDQLPPGNYSVHAQHPSYPQTPTTMALNQSTIGPGEQKRGLDLKLTPSATISGRVTDSDGDPIQNCNVNAVSRYQRMGVQGQTNTHADGAYLIVNLPAGKYYLQARCQAPLLQPRPFAPPDAVLPGPQLGYTTVFYPGTPNFSSAQRVTAVAGQELRGQDFRMVVQKVSTLSIHVTGIESKGRNRLMASLLPDDGGPARPMDTHSGTVQPQTGIARIGNLSPGKYNLQIQSFAPERAIVARQPVEIGEESREIAVQANPPVAVSGTLRIAEQSADLKPTRLWLSQTDEQGFQSQAELKPDGSFVFPALAPGKYRVAFDRASFVQSVSVGSESFDGPEFELKPGSTGPLQIAMSSATGKISGEIQGASAQAAQIRVFATVSGQGGQCQAVPDGSHKYTLSLAPGRYRVYAYEETPQMPFFYLLANDAITALGETVDVRAGSETVHNLKLITAADIEKADQ